jgi:RNA recognition motif-containing protein
MILKFKNFVLFFSFCTSFFPLSFSTRKLYFVFCEKVCCQSIVFSMNKKCVLFLKAKKMSEISEMNRAIFGRDPEPQTSKADYIDRRQAGRFPSIEKYLEHRQQLLDNSNTVYVGNLGFMTSEELIHNHFSQCGAIRRIHMGLHAISKKPCGFCFVEFLDRESAILAVNTLVGSILDDRVINVTLDTGSVREEQRFWGRSITGGQVRDAVRHDVDLGRGGVGQRDAAAKGLHTTIQNNNSNNSGIIQYTWEQSPSWVVALNAGEKKKETQQQQQQDQQNKKTLVIQGGVAGVIRQRN